MGKTSAWRSTAIAVALVLLLGGALLLAGCGEKVAEQNIEKQIEEALESEGADVDVDLSDDDSGSISITDDDGDAEISFGGAADVPEGFPSELLPDGIDIQSSVNAGQGDGSMQTVTFTSDKDLDEMYEWFLDALPRAGYKVEHKMQFDAAGNSGFTIAGSGSGANVNVTGAEDGGKFIYAVMIAGG